MKIKDTLNRFIYIAVLIMLLLITSGCLRVSSEYLGGAAAGLTFIGLIIVVLTGITTTGILWWKKDSLGGGLGTLICAIAAGITLIVLFAPTLERGIKAIVNLIF